MATSKLRVAFLSIASFIVHCFDVLAYALTAPIVFVVNVVIDAVEMAFPVASIRGIGLSTSSPFAHWIATSRAKPSSSERVNIPPIRAAGSCTPSATRRCSPDPAIPG